MDQIRTSQARHRQAWQALAEDTIGILRLGLVLLGLLIVLAWPALIHPYRWQAVPLLAVLGCYSLVLIALRPHRRYPDRPIRTVIAVVDATLIMCWLVLTGGLSSPFYPLIYVGVAGVAFRFPWRQTALGVSCYALAYLLMGLLLQQAAGLELEIAIRVAAMGVLAAFGGIMTHYTEREASTRRLAEHQMILAGLAEARLREIVEAVPDAVLIARAEGTVLLVNGAAEQLLGLSREALINAQLAQLLPTLDLQAEATFAVDPLPFQIERRDGTQVPADVRISAIRTDDGPLLILSLRDMSERYEAERQLRQREAQLAEAQQIAHLGSWEYFIETHSLLWSDEMYRIHGLEPGIAAPTPDEYLHFVHEQDREQVILLFRSAAAQHSGTRLDVRVVRPDGSQRSIHIRGDFTDAGPSGPRLIGTAQDITERKQVEDRLLYNAFHDTLTELANRALFLDRLRHGLRRALRSKRPLAVLFIDLDHFKLINDSLGHLAGDQLLIEVSQRLVACLRPGDTIARMGGDEFTILLEDLPHEEFVWQIATRINEMLALPMMIDGHELVISASVGVVISTGENTRPEDLLRDADSALYYAKAQGRARFEVFNRELHQQALQRLHLEADLRQGLDRGELGLYYQPIISLQTGLVLGVEALVRWNHPQRGLLLPGEFMQIAEDVGLSVRINEQVLEEACAQGVRWNALLGRPLYVAVNLSARQFKHKLLGALIASVLAKTDLPPICLELEVLEHDVMEQAEVTMTLLRELRELGVGLAIDDFGTGYSSLSYLRRFPIQMLKIDRSFVEDVPDSGVASSITSAIIAMAHSLDLRVVAEGVEREDQLRFLIEQGCDVAQGYLFCPPMRAEELEPLLGERLFAIEGGRLVVRPLTRHQSGQSAA